MKFCPVVLALVPLFACNSEPAPVEGGGAVEQEEWKAVATFENPSLSEEGKAAYDALIEALRAKGIHAVAAGSRGFTLSVAESQLEKARGICAEVIEDGELEAQLVE